MHPIRLRGARTHNLQGIDLDLKTTPLPEDANCTYKGIVVACGPPGLEGGKNILYHNKGDGTFEASTNVPGGCGYGGGALVDARLGGAARCPGTAARGHRLSHPSSGGRAGRGGPAPAAARPGPGSAWPGPPSGCPAAGWPGTAHGRSRGRPRCCRPGRTHSA